MHAATTTLLCTDLLFCSCNCHMSRHMVNILSHALNVQQACSLSALHPDIGNCTELLPNMMLPQHAAFVH